MTHVDRVLPPATPDSEVLSWATGESRLIVTANDTDFLRLAREGSGHPGLGFIDDQNTRVRQISAVEQLVRVLLAHTDGGGMLVDHVFVRRRTGRLAIRRIPQMLDKTDPQRR